MTTTNYDQGQNLVNWVKYFYDFRFLPGLAKLFTISYYAESSQLNFTVQDLNQGKYRKGFCPLRKQK